METPNHSSAVRERYLSLPTRDDGYRQVLLLGTTGAGKTTLVRQLLGTDPEHDRFPSTSTAKTTVSDSEIILTSGPFQAIVTFFTRGEVTRHLEECVIRASVSILNGLGPSLIRGHLLDHEQQRFRFSYVLGRRVELATRQSKQTDVLDPFDVFDEPEVTETHGESVDFRADPQTLPTIDLAATEAAIERAIGTLQDLVSSYSDTARRELGVVSAEDEKELKELLEEELGRLLQTDPRFDEIVSLLLAEIDKRFSALSIGEIDRGDDGWPLSWKWKSDDRTAFLRAVNRFSSNYAPLFGHLLSPLVDGIRVAGPFAPSWTGGAIPPLVLIDGEGLGHTPTSVAALSTSVAERINTVDVVLLVDNAAQPMQAAPAAAIRSILTSGNVDKLVFCFTHFDEVAGDNLASARDRANHVLGSANNLLATIRTDFHQRDELALSRRLDAATIFLSRIDKALDPSDIDGRFTINSLSKLLDAIEKASTRPGLGPARPIYDKAELRNAVITALAQFHYRWDAILGLSPSRTVAREHWARIKALNKRFVEGSDQYDTLRPSAELREFVKEELYRRLESPMGWSGVRPDDAEHTAIVNEFAQAVARSLNAPIQERLSTAAQSEWRYSFGLHGPGSTRIRADHIAHDIFDRFVPEAASSDNSFVRDVLTVVGAAAAQVDAAIE